MRGILAAVLSLALIGCGAPMTDQNTDKNTDKNRAQKYLMLDEATPDAAYPPGIRELNFKSAGHRLNGLMYQANGAGPHPTVILLHGYPGNEKNLDLAQALRSEGFNVLFFHYRGAWGSEGEFSYTHVIEDVGSAVSFLKMKGESYRVDPHKILLVGHSMGGFAALQGAANDPAISCVAGIAAANFGGRAALLSEGSDAVKGFVAYADNLQMLSEWSGRKAVAEIKQNADAFNLDTLGPRLAGKSVLLIAGDKDTAVSAQTVHVPMVAAYQAQDGIDLTARILSGDHSFSWSRGSLIASVVEWADGCR